jgi:hypothetical protein
MAREDITQEEVLGQVVEHLRAALHLGPTQCVEAIEPSAPPGIARGGEFWVTVSPNEGQFPEGEQAPGNITEEWGVTVTAYSRIRLDPTDTDEKLLRDAARGLLEAKRRILAAMVGQDLQSDRTPPTAFLRNLVYASYCSRPQYDDAKNVGWISVDFGIHFDWDLSGELGEV